MQAAVCATCGRPLDLHTRDIRFKYPEPVLDLSDGEKKARIWGDDARMGVDGVGLFIRVLVPVRLTDGYSFSFGAWLGVAPDDFDRACDIWWEPKYQDLILDGYLANMLPPWERETIARPLQAAVRSADELPYATSSTDSFLQTVLSHEWPHEDILPALAQYVGE